MAIGADDGMGRAPWPCADSRHVRQHKQIPTGHVRMSMFACPRMSTCALVRARNRAICCARCTVLRIHSAQSSSIGQLA